MDTPRILAIDDVHLAAPRGVAEALHAFYAGLIGLNPMQTGSPEESAVFRGYPRSGPRLVVSLGERPAGQPLRRNVLIQVASLADCAEQIADAGNTCTWLRGWTPYDQRLTTLDPGGNHVELVTFHPF